MSLLPLRRRGFALLAALLLVEGAVLVVACSSSSSTTDEQTEGGQPDTGSTPPDAAKDSPAPPPPDSGKQGNCTPVKGACDLVLQDCPQKNGSAQECVVTTSGGSPSTVCIPVQASQQLPQGHACCPGADNPCLPGLTCVGNACTDGGPQTGRCSPACCDGDDLSCGKSDPEGISGACNLTLSIDGGAITNVCTYSIRCKPFGIEPCGVTDVCLIEGTIGTATCTLSNGKTIGQPCTYANDCADGLMCLDTTGDGGVCRMLCLTPGSVHPFDASVEEGGAGQGGCVSGAHCSGNGGALGPFSNLPAWLSFCSFPDGG